MRRPAKIGVALIGTGRVARALAARVDRLRRQGALGGLALVGIANARGQWRVADGPWSEALAEAAGWPARERDRARVPEPEADWSLVIDASDAETVAARHPDWLAAGIAVVTANKRGLGEDAARAQAILARLAAGAFYGASATVGAGLGIVERLKRMREQGERVLAIEGVLSGTLAFVLERLGQGQSLAEAVRSAISLGLAEPDPREDLAGLDAARKLRILARLAGLAGADREVAIDPRLAAAASERDTAAALERLAAALAPLLGRRPSAHARLAAVARADEGGPRIVLEWLHPLDPLAQRVGPENVVLLRSERYREHPLLLRGPGAGPELTAMALLDDCVAPGAAGRTSARGSAASPGVFAGG
ncbi:MAG: homoserine dehydrogenase [Xanthomonadales bacterium]|nr:homoserine dehydrogenase [Xanthomonadales bacterium]